MKVLFTPLAERQLDALYQYVSTHAGTERADICINRIIDFCNAFVTFPLRTTRRAWKKQW